MKCKGIEALKRKVLKKIKPSASEERRQEKLAEKIWTRIGRVTPNNVEVKLMGSVEKGTNLKGKADFDFFLLFPKSYSKHEMCMLGLSYAKRAAKGTPYQIRYAEHPYLRTVFEGCRVDMVPAYKIESIEERGTSVDRSQLHTRYVKERMNQEQKDDVRLLKQFMKNIGVYGAELRVEGFSGYACELLILHYGSFEGVLKASAKWREPSVDIEGYHKGEERKAFSAPVVIIDPVDAKRNVTAVVSQTSLSRFVLAARSFLKKPSMKAFFLEKVVHGKKTLKEIVRKRKARIIALEFGAPDVVEDVLWPQLKKTATAVLKALSMNEFSPLGHYFWSDGKRCVIFVELAVWKLPAVKKVAGPAVALGEDVEGFLRAHKDALNVHVEHEKVVAIERRKVQKAEEAVRLAIKSPLKYGVPENFIKCFSRAKFLSEREILGSRYREFISDYYTRRIE